MTTKSYVAFGSFTQLFSAPALIQAARRARFAAEILGPPGGIEPELIVW